MNIPKLFQNASFGRLLFSNVGWAKAQPTLEPSVFKELGYIPQFLKNQTQQFKPCHPLGLYPVVDSSAWVETLLSLGVRSIQLRIKESTATLDAEIIKSIALAKQYGATLFINDYWELALRYGAQGIHLGQGDLDSADLAAIRRADLLLGVSTHCLEEVERACTIGPSYVACGPIYPTTSKIMPFAPQGIEQLRYWRRMLHYPLVAIGGINLERLPAIIATRVDGIALISAITKATDPAIATRALLAVIARESKRVRL